jgi:hypothetical protein
MYLCLYYYYTKVTKTNACIKFVISDPTVKFLLSNILLYKCHLPTGLFVHVNTNEFLHNYAKEKI